MSNHYLKYQIDTEENRSFLTELREELLSFGQKFPSPGGGSYYLGDDGTPWKERNRETWITSRMAHVYSMVRMYYGLPRWLSGKESACQCGLGFWVETIP